MRRYLFSFIVLVCSIDAHALESLRVGSQLLVVGDSAAKVKELMGNPSLTTKAPNEKRSGKTKSSSRSVGKRQPQQAKEKGEKWQYRHDGHTTIFTMANGKIVHIEDFAR